jgi:hypothetical protein
MGYYPVKVSVEDGDGFFKPPGEMSPAKTDDLLSPDKGMYQAVDERAWKFQVEVVVRSEKSELIGPSKRFQDAYASS